MVEGDNDIPEPKAEYIAGIFDAKKAIEAGPRKDESYSLKYTIYVNLSIKSSDSRLIAILEQWAINNGVNPPIRQEGNQYVWKITRREDVNTLLEVVKPHLLVEYEVAEMVYNIIIPELNNGTHRTRRGFLELIEVTQEIQKRNTPGKKSKYTTDYFLELWEGELNDTV